MGDYDILIHFFSGLKGNYQELTGNPRITPKLKNGFVDRLRGITDPIINRMDDYQQPNIYIYSLIGDFLASVDIQDYTYSRGLEQFYQQEIPYTGDFPVTTNLLRKSGIIDASNSLRSPTNLWGSVLGVLFQLYGRPIREEDRDLIPVIFNQKRGVIRDLLVPEGEDALSFDLCMLNDSSSIQKPIGAIMAGTPGYNNGFIYPNYLNPDA